MRRGVGVSAVKKKRATASRYADAASKLEATQEAHVTEILSTFRSSLEEFARKHKKKIKKDPVFRARFTEMCYEIGVDPLRSSKGFWTVLGLGDFYYELGVKVIEACASTRDADGGLRTMRDLENRLDVTQDDLKKAIKKLGILGQGFKIILKGTVVLSVPRELSNDQTAALDLSRRGRLTRTDLQQSIGTERSDQVLSQLLKDGFCWKDDVDDSYYFPTVWGAADDDDDDETR